VNDFIHTQTTRNPPKRQCRAVTPDIANDEYRPGGNHAQQIEIVIATNHERIHATRFLILANIAIKNVQPKIQ
jgi:hypothetical protein